MKKSTVTITEIRIIQEQFQGSSFSFLRMQRQSEADYGQTIKGGVIYLHRWPTGFQELIFDNDRQASNWWTAEKARLLQQKN